MTGGSEEVLVVLCDVGPTYGVGHLMRCIALAEEFADSGTTVVFAADVGSVPFALEQVQARGFRHVPAPDGVRAHLDLLVELGATGAVIDSYHLPLELYDAVREVVPLLAFADGDPGGRSADLLLDQNIGAEDDDWPLEAGTQRVAGLEYALMRTEILRRRPERPRTQEQQPLRVFAFFGGTDAFGAGPVLAAALIGTGLPFALRVVAPTAWEHVPQPAPGQSVEVIGPTDRLADEVLAADLVISAAGTSSWELLCLGAACAFVCVADNQQIAYRRTVEAGLGVGLGELADIAADPAGATVALSGALNDGAARAALRARGHARVDGAGRARVRQAFGRLGG